MKNTKRKGFTIVELVIVIAVIAILAAVLIPTFASLINKANRSADVQAVRQMNTQLAIGEVESNMTIVDVYAALEEGGMTAKDYNPLASDTYFFWDSELNRVLYTDGEYKVQYPEEYKDAKSGKDGHQWYSLNNKIKGEEYNEETSDGTTTIKVTTGGQLYQAIQDLNESEDSITLKGAKGGNPAITAKFQNSINKNTTIELDADIDMMGASLSIGAVKKGVTLTINGGSHTISGIVNLDNAIDNAALNAENNERNYYSGIVKYIDGENVNSVWTKGKVIFKDITFKNIVGGRSDVGSSGLLVGNSKGDVEFEDVVINNSTLYGKNKLGAFVGGVYCQDQNITVKGNKTKLSNVNIISTEGEAGILFGSTSNTGVNGNVKIDSQLFTDSKISFIENCSVVCNGKNMKDITAPSSSNATLDGKAVEKGDTKNEFRVTTAYIGFAALVNEYDNTNNVVSKFNPINTYDQAVAAGWIYNFTSGSKVTSTQ